VDGRLIRNARGPITAALQKAFFACVSGKSAKRRRWLTPVVAAKKIAKARR
jgi:hypothetical protein